MWPLQVAIYERLSNDATLGEMITGVYDDVEAGEEFPYIVIGDPTVTPFDTKTSIGENVVVDIHSWSRYDGKKESYDILNAALEALKEPLPLGNGFVMQRQGREQLQVITDIDGTTRHGILRVRFYINK